MTQSQLPAIIANLPKVKSQEELHQALVQYRDQFNILIPPAMNFSSSLHAVALEPVFIDNTVDNFHNGPDIYSVDGGKSFTLHTRAANKIAAAAGIRWLRSEIKNRETDDDGRTTFIEHTVTWSIARPNGSVRQGEATGTYKMAEDKVRFNTKQAESRRHFAEGLAESNAKLRAIYDALDQLPRSMTRQDYAKPFIVPCVVDNFMDLVKDDPEMKRMMIAAKLGIQGQIYGDEHRPKAVVAQAEVVNDPPPETAAATTTASPTAPPSPDDKEAFTVFYRTRFVKEDLIGMIVSLIRDTAYAVAPGTTKPEDMDVVTLVEYLRHLTIRKNSQGGRSATKSNLPFPVEEGGR